MGRKSLCTIYRFVRQKELQRKETEAEPWRPRPQLTGAQLGMDHGSKRPQLRSERLLFKSFAAARQSAVPRMLNRHYPQVGVVLDGPVVDKRPQMPD